MSYKSGNFRKKISENPQENFFMLTLIFVFLVPKNVSTGYIRLHHNHVLQIFKEIYIHSISKSS